MQQTETKIAYNKYREYNKSPMFCLLRSTPNCNQTHGAFCILIGGYMAISKINHTQISNDFIDNYMFLLSGADVKIFLAISRKTIGWHKDTDFISIMQLRKMTGIGKTQVIESIKVLKRFDLVLSKGEERKIKRYSINYSGTDSEPIGTDSEPDQVKTGTDSEHTKESIKETKQKIYRDILIFWNEKIIEFKNDSSKKNLTKHTEKCFIRNLQKKHKDIINEYGIEEVLKAIEKFIIIFYSEVHYWTHPYTLWDFLKRGIDRFIDEADPFNNFKKDKTEIAEPTDIFENMSDEDKEKLRAYEERMEKKRAEK